MTILWILLGLLLASIAIVGIAMVKWFNQLDELTNVWNEEDFM